MRTLILCLTVLILCLIPNWPSPAAAQTDTPPVVGLMVRDQFASGWWVQIQIRNDATIAAWSPNAPALDANCVRRAGEGQTLSGTNMYCWVPSFPQVYDTYWIATDAGTFGPYAIPPLDTAPGWYILAPGAGIPQRVEFVYLPIVE